MAKSTNRFLHGHNAPRVVVRGERYSRLIVLEELPERSGRKRRYLCICDCGNRIETTGNALRTGHTRSCGCLGRHGHARLGNWSPTYQTWVSMLNRVRNPNAVTWRYYGGRGIEVCKRWQSFEAFLADMGERPEGTTLDRVDPDGNYELANCRWATAKQQANNRRRRRDSARSPSHRSR